MKEEFIIVGWESNNIWKVADVIKSVDEDLNYQKADDIWEALIFEDFKSANELKDKLNQEYIEITFYVLLKEYQLSPVELA